MRLVLRRRAVLDLQNIFDWIAKDNPRAAVRTVSRLWDRMNQLSEPGFARMGRRGHRPGARELSEHPHIIVYRIHERRDEIIVLAVFHGARNR